MFWWTSCIRGNKTPLPKWNEKKKDITPVVLAAPSRFCVIVCIYVLYVRGTRTLCWKPMISTIVETLCGPWKQSCYVSNKCSHRCWGVEHYVIPLSDYPSVSLSTCLSMCLSIMSSPQQWHHVQCITLSPQKQLSWHYTTFGSIVSITRKVLHAMASNLRICHNVDYLKMSLIHICSSKSVWSVINSNIQGIRSICFCG